MICTTTLRENIILRKYTVVKYMITTHVALARLTSSWASRSLLWTNFVHLHTSRFYNLLQHIHCTMSVISKSSNVQRYYTTCTGIIAVSNTIQPQHGYRYNRRYSICRSFDVLCVWRVFVSQHTHVRPAGLHTLDKLLYVR